MTDSIKMLQHVAAQLQQEGKTPSLALFRARLAGQINPPQLFSAYQHWRANPIFAIDTALTSNLNATSSHQLSAENSDNDVAIRLSRIETKLDQILQKLEQQ